MGAISVPVAGGDAGLSPFRESLTVEEYVREYFEEVPILTEIARCESRFRHFDAFGNVMRGEINSYDIGVMQINELYHEEKAEELGLNLYTLAGNLTYARYLYDTKGTAPWKSSAACWNAYNNHVAINQ